MKDQEIIKMIENGKEDRALSQIYKGYSVIEKSLLKLGANKEQSMDIFQEALYLTVKKIRAGNFELSAQLSTYLFSVCRFMYLNEARKKGVTVEFDDELTMVEQSYDWEAEERNQKAESAFEQLGQKCKDILTAYYNKGWSMTVIASKFGFSTEKSAKNQKYKCMEKARSFFGDLMHSSSTENTSV